MDEILKCTEVLKTFNMRRRVQRTGVEIVTLTRHLVGYDGTHWSIQLNSMSLLGMHCLQMCDDDAGLAQYPPAVVDISRAWKYGQIPPTYPPSGKCVSHIQERCHLLSGTADQALPRSQVCVIVNNNHHHQHHHNHQHHHRLWRQAGISCTHRGGHPGGMEGQGHPLRTAVPGEGPDWPSGAKYPLTHVVTRHFILAIGARIADVDALFIRQVTTKVIIGLVSNEAFVSAWQRIPTTSYIWTWIQPA